MGLGVIRNRIVRALLGADFPRMSAQLAELSAWREHYDARAAEMERATAAIERGVAAQTELLRRERDGVPARIEELAALRSTPEYHAAFDEAEPLITVRIASYRKTRELVDVAIASVLAQTYQNFEIVVVNDGPNEETRAAIAELDDPRIHYEEFPERTRYPSDPHARWMVAGSPGMNRGADLARGVWIAPLDDDDEFTPDHLERLLALALDRRAELAYGALIQRNLVNETEARIWSDPPAISQFSFQGAIYLRLLHTVFRYDESSWLVQEPGDWNLVRRMSAAGVRMSGTPEVVAIMNQVPYTHKIGSD